MSNILVLNGPSYASAVMGLGTIHLSKKSFLSNPKDFGLVLFTGGADVSPKLYNDTSPYGYCYNNVQRDIEEIEVFEVAREHGVLMAGICRGVQFLNVMAGGKMMHHIKGHEGGVGHKMTCPGMRREIMVNSLHHQMILPTGEAHIIGWTTERRSSMYVGEEDRKLRYDGPEIEAAIFPNIRGLGVQYHPEMMDEDTEGFQFFFNMVRAAMEKPFEEVIRLYVEGDEKFEYTTIRHGNVHTAG